MKKLRLIKQSYSRFLAMQIMALIFLSVSGPVFALPAAEEVAEDGKSTLDENLKVAKALEDL